MFRFAVFVARVLCHAALTAALALSLSSSPLSSPAVPVFDGA